MTRLDTFIVVALAIEFIFMMTVVVVTILEDRNL
jgi:hypothetical protein